MEKNNVTKLIQGKARRRLEVGDLVKLVDEPDYDGHFVVTEPMCLTQLPDKEGLSLVGVVEPVDIDQFIDYFTVLRQKPCIDKDGNEIDLKTITGFDISIELDKLELYNPTPEIKVIKEC